MTQDDLRAVEMLYKIVFDDDGGTIKLVTLSEEGPFAEDEDRPRRQRQGDLDSFAPEAQSVALVRDHQDGIVRGIKWLLGLVDADNTDVTVENPGMYVDPCGVEQLLCLGIPEVFRSGHDLEIIR